MGQVIPFPRSEPISAINATPFIDVLLVLLIMLILAVPVATHKLPVDLPTGGGVELERPHQLAIDRGGALTWDGNPITDAQLHNRLTAMQGASATATLHVKTDPETPYERFNSILGAVKRAGIERLGLVGNQPFEQP